LAKIIESGNPGHLPHKGQSGVSHAGVRTAFDFVYGHAC
jgi:hypothetical protein